MIDNEPTTESDATFEMDTFNSPMPEPEQARLKGKAVSTEVVLNKRDYAIGICLLLVVVFLWTSSNFVTQDLFEDGYEKPFLVTYLNTSAFTLYLLPFLIRRLWSRWKGGQTALSSDGARVGYQSLANDPEQADDVVLREPSAERITIVEEELPPLTLRETAQLAFIFCFFWFIANWAVNASLDYTSVASATILSAMSGFFTLVIGRVFGVEHLTVAKVGAVLTSFAGVVLVSLSDSSKPQPSGSPRPSPSLVATATDEGSQPMLGDALALLGAIFYALYVILLKVRIRSESRIDMQLFFGFVGLFNVLSCWPIGLVLHLAGVERFELPSSRRAVIALLINMAITWSSDYIYVLAMLKTTPLVVTVGLSLTIPLAVVGDFLLSKPVKGQVILGAVLVIASFVAIGVDDSDSAGKEKIIVVDSAVGEEGADQVDGDPDETIDGR
ncbi:hypothetical protein JAAARDRAFT_53817 [Jaapia argillacea MUCL 33604]|uniref:DUF3955 domain-containing protein n=1 Tax=Jaapia argillacea MUCL 33604 TaxID=933084 RepID=A0A067QBS9_9AGAM|nr:hypothetical protein JAAARDRAFT_53817 [Jaapia argillacea MUCL 33604]